MLGPTVVVARRCGGGEWLFWKGECSCAVAVLEKGGRLLHKSWKCRTQKLLQTRIVRFDYHNNKGVVPLT